MTANFENISSSLLSQIQSDDEYKKYFQNKANKKNVSEAKSLSEISLVVNCVALETVESESERAILSKFPFAKNDTEDGRTVLTEECLDDMLHNIDVINDLQHIADIDEQQQEESVKNHATARILLFYRTCSAYYNSKPTEMIRYAKTTTQIGKGIRQNDTEACHHAIFCEFENDLYYAAQLREKLKNSIANNDSKTVKKVTSVLKKLLFLGVAGDRIEQFLKKQQVGMPPSKRDLDTIFSQKLLTSKLIDDRCRLFYQNNHTLIAEGAVNGADDCIEH